MCTVITDSRQQLFGRTMDFPPRTPWKLTYLPRQTTWAVPQAQERVSNQHAILGGMRVVDGHYLIGDGINDAGLVCAELFFPVAAEYPVTVRPQTMRLTPQDVVGWLLGRHASVAEVAADLATVTVVGDPWFDGQRYPFHWLLMDDTGTYVIEPLDGQLRLRLNPSEVLTNTPALSQHFQRLNQVVGVNGEDFGPQTVAAIAAGNYQLPRGGNSVQRFCQAAIWRWQNTERDEGAFWRFLQTVTVPHTPAHEHNYTHYRALINRHTQSYSFQDCHTGKTTTVNLPQLIRTTQQVRRFN